MSFWRTSPPDTTYALFFGLNLFTAQSELQVRSSPGFPLLHLRGIGEFPTGPTKLKEYGGKSRFLLVLLATCSPSSMSPLLGK